jgi:hypothetical protein
VGQAIVALEYEDHGGGGMKEKSGVGQCVYCLREHVDLTEDHVFPGRWYPPTTPSNMEKWKVPACYPCNHTSGGNENDLLIRLGLCVEGADLESRFVREKALRAINPRCARGPIDLLHRLKKRASIRKDLAPVAQDAKARDFLPGFTPGPGVDPKKMIRLKIDAAALKAFGGKMVRGFAYVFEKKIIRRTHAIRVFFPHEQDLEDLISQIKLGGETKSRGPGFEVSRAVAVDRPDWFITRIFIWGRFPVVGVVMSSDEPILRDPEEAGEE